MPLQDVEQIIQAHTVLPVLVLFFLSDSIFTDLPISLFQWVMMVNLLLCYMKVKLRKGHRVYQRTNHALILPY